MRPAPVDKLIQRAGVASLREARQMVWAGRVTVNGTVQTSCKVAARTDEVAVDGRSLPAPEPSRLFLFHKPPGLLDHKGIDHRSAIRLPADLQHVVIIGGLGFGDEGALLLTNDGRLAKLIELSRWTACTRL